MSSTDGHCICFLFKSELRTLRDYLHDASFLFDTRNYIRVRAIHQPFLTRTPTRRRKPKLALESSTEGGLGIVPDRACYCGERLAATTQFARSCAQAPLRKILHGRLA